MKADTPFRRLRADIPGRAIHTPAFDFHPIARLSGWQISADEESGSARALFARLHVLRVEGQSVAGESFRLELDEQEAPDLTGMALAALGVGLAGTLIVGLLGRRAGSSAKELS